MTRKTTSLTILIIGLIILSTGAYLFFYRTAILDSKSAKALTSTPTPTQQGAGASSSIQKSIVEAAVSGIESYRNADYQDENYVGYNHPEVLGFSGVRQN